MLVTGVIVEYNPMHNGHQYHLQEARRLTEADVIICVLSGNFTQRGEPAVVNKWARTRMALAQGADLVLELPVVYAAQHAQGFASGAIKTLNSTGVVNHLVFGSEHGQIEELQALAEFLLEEPPLLKQNLKKYLEQGYLYPAARTASVLDYHQARGIAQLKGFSPREVQAFIRHPNNILGLEYLQALLRTNSNIRPMTLKRRGAGYHQQEIGEGRIASATAIRRMLAKDQRGPSLEQVMPAQCLKILRQETAAGRGPIFWDSFASSLLSLLRRSEIEELGQVAGMAEGLEHRLQRAAHNNGTLEGLLEDLKTKRYTLTRLQRLLTHFLLSFNRQDMELFAPGSQPGYLRILGFSHRGRKLLPIMKQRADLPLVTQPARQLHPLIKTSPRIARLWQLECKATDLYVLAYSDPKYRKGGQDYLQPLVITN